MHYQVLMLNVPNELYGAIKHRLQGIKVNFTVALTLHDAALLCERHRFHLAILHFFEGTPYSEFLIALRRVSHAPIVVLLDTDNTENLCCALQSGADLSVGPGWPVDLVADHTLAQFRRYTAYDGLENRQEKNCVDFQKGDLYIDPSRSVVRVKKRSVKLRRREFLLLLYFMRNPKIVLSADQICSHAWGNEGSYAQGVSGPIAILRKAIEPNPAQPIYIKTVKSFGYCFTAYNSETCDICSDSVGFL